MIHRLESVTARESEMPLVESYRDLPGLDRRQIGTWLFGVVNPDDAVHAISAAYDSIQDREAAAHFRWAVERAVTDILLSYLDKTTPSSPADVKVIENLATLVLKLYIPAAVPAIYGLSRSSTADLVLLRVGDPRPLKERWRAYWEGDDSDRWLAGWEGILRTDPEAIFKEFPLAFRRQNFQLREAMSLVHTIVPSHVVQRKRVEIRGSADPMGDAMAALEILDAA